MAASPCVGEANTGHMTFTEFQQKWWPQPMPSSSCIVSAASLKLSAWRFSCSLSLLVVLGMATARSRNRTPGAAASMKKSAQQLQQPAGGGSNHWPS